MATAGIVAKELGGTTFLNMVWNWSALTAANATGVAIVSALLVSIINSILMSLAFELGILLGYAITPAPCREE